MWLCLHRQGVTVTLPGSHRPDSSGRGDRTFASGETDGPVDQRDGCEGKVEKGRRGGGRGVSQHAAPLGRQAITSKALPPLRSLLRNILKGEDGGKDHECDQNLI